MKYKITRVGSIRLGQRNFPGNLYECTKAVNVYPYVDLREPLASNRDMNEFLPDVDAQLNIADYFVI